jgi:membrane-bound lytic murein transglycosylase D
MYKKHVLLQTKTILRIRIKMMYVEYLKMGRWNRALIMLLMTCLATATAYASRGFVQDRHITLEEAKILAEKASEKSDFPIVMNAEVLSQLNRLLGTPEGRNFVRSSLKRKENFNSVLEEVTGKYNTPEELNAIPITESGYQNLPSRGKVRSAGLWMFIPATARKYGMAVKKGTDERLNIMKETEAAHRYLLSNKLVFNDWLLAIFAYNVGEGAVERGIKKYKTRDPWELAKFVKGDKDYMSKVMASIIIMKNPDSLDQ